MSELAIKKNKTKHYQLMFLYFILIEVILFGIALSNVNNEVIFSNINLTIVLMINILLLICYRKNIFLFLIFLFCLYSNISIAFGLYYFKLPAYSHLINMLPKEILSYGSLLFALFRFIIQVLLLFFLKKTNWNGTSSYRFPCNPSFLMFLLIFVVTIGIFVLSVFYFNDKTATLLEYTSILILLGYYFANKSNHEDKLLTLIAVLILIRLLFIGGRITAIQMAFIIFAYYFLHKFNYGVIFFVFCLGVIGLTFVGFLGDGYANPTFDLFLEKVQEKMMTNDTSVYAYFASMRFLETIDIVSFGERFKLFTNFIIAIFAGNMSDPSVSVPAFTAKYFAHWYGGLLPFHLFFYLSYFGLFIASFGMAFFIYKVSSINLYSGSFWRLFSVYFLFTCTRWYLYGPETLSRGFLLFFVLYNLFKLIARSFKLTPLLLTFKRTI